MDERTPANGRYVAGGYPCVIEWLVNNVYGTLCVDLELQRSGLASIILLQRSSGQISCYFQNGRAVLQVRQVSRVKHKRRVSDRDRRDVRKMGRILEDERR